MKSISTLKIRNGLTEQQVKLTEGHWAYFEFNVHPFYQNALTE